MRVLVDTSVWSLALRRRKGESSAAVEALQSLIEDGKVTLIGPIRQEILSGIRHEEQFKKIKSALEPFPDEAIETEDYTNAAQLCNHCLNKGVITGSIDSLIASIAIKSNYELLTTDKDFTHIANVSALKLFATSS